MCGGFSVAPCCLLILGPPPWRQALTMLLVDLGVNPLETSISGNTVGHAGTASRPRKSGTLAATSPSSLEPSRVSRAGTLTTRPVGPKPNWGRTIVKRLACSHHLTSAKRQAQCESVCQHTRHSIHGLIASCTSDPRKHTSN